MPQTGTMSGGVSNFIDTVRVGETDYPIKPSIMQKVTYEQLVGLRQANKLVEGHWYRITDYQCTTTQEGTQSAGHQFDIIVRADDKYALNENAFAIEHEGDTYFQNANLSAWELKYCLDNDTNRFAWADPTNGKGVIYYMKDEFNNECPYDFKNIQYVFEEGFEYNKWGRTYAVNRNSSLDTEVDGTMYYGYTANSKPDGWTDNNCYTKNLVTSVSEPLYSAPNGSLLTGGNIIKVNIESFIAYTFDDNGNDATLATEHRCYNNHISPYYFSNYYGGGYKNYFILNSIFAKKDLDTNLYFNNNIFGNGCHNITLSGANYNNIFGNGCYNITFGDNCTNNTFGNNCYNNVFGINCSNNTFGNGCGGNTFGDGCSYNIFENSCYNITFGDNCTNNTFGNNCANSTFGNNCSYNIFGDGCVSNTFGSSTQSPQAYFENIIFENGNKLIHLTCNQTTSSSSKCQNILVALGVNNTNTVKTITIDAVNQTNRTVVRSAADTEITA